MSRRAPGAAATNTSFSKAQPGLLKRGKAALEPAKPEPKPKSPKSILDPAHPIRGGGVRKKAYASRPIRRKGTPEWLSRQLDSWQERTLRIAYYIHKHLPSRLQVCLFDTVTVNRCKIDIDFPARILDKTWARVPQITEHRPQIRL